MWYNGLIFKLLAIEILHQLVNIFKSFLINRIFFEKLGDHQQYPGKSNE